MANKIELTTDQMAYLANIETSLSNAMQYDYIRVVNPKEIDEVKTIYKAATNSTEYDGRGCGSCTLGVYKKLGRLYFTQKEQKKSQTPLEQQKRKRSTKK